MSQGKWGGERNREAERGRDREGETEREGGRNSEKESEREGERKNKYFSFFFVSLNSVSWTLQLCRTPMCILRSSY